MINHHHKRPSPKRKRTEPMRGELSRNSRSHSYVQALEARMSNLERLIQHVRRSPPSAQSPIFLANSPGSTNSMTHLKPCHRSTVVPPSVTVNQKMTSSPARSWVPSSRGYIANPWMLILRHPPRERITVMTNSRIRTQTWTKPYSLERITR